MPGASIGYVAICLIAGVAMIAYSIHQRSRLRASESWHHAMGTITRADLVRRDSTDSVEYQVSVFYDYLVKGVGYTGKRIEFGSRGFARKKRAESELAKYPVNSNVMVYFNPDKADEAVLVRSAPYSTLYLVLGMLLLAVALGIVVFSVIGGR
ncbi:MAG TPA: DUF3592 domain-containing protein [Verrucomicrobiae bacterium]|nr:DUF3592 domain-containing protein [Verrucomicrobiae bacterium]